MNLKYRKIARNFRARIELMERIPQEDSIKLFFEMCNLFLTNYIKIESERFPNKSMKEIIINMHERRDKLRKRKEINGIHL